MVLSIFFIRFFTPWTPLFASPGSSRVEKKSEFSSACKTYNTIDISYNIHAQIERKRVIIPKIASLKFLPKLFFFFCVLFQFVVLDNN